MCVRMMKAALCVFVLLISVDISAGNTELKELERRCEDAREVQIAPLRKKAIEECVEAFEKEGRYTDHTPEKCELFYRDYGEGEHVTTGGQGKRMFDDLPECLEFYDAEKASKKDSK